jgi:hypothetical protein
MKTAGRYGRRISDYARVGHLLSAVTGSRPRGGRRRVLELSASCSLRRAWPIDRWNPVRPSRARRLAPDRIVALNADYAWTDDRKSVFLKIAHGREILGVIELAGPTGRTGATTISTWP